MSTSLPDPSTQRPRPGQLTFPAPRRGKPPQHLADLDPAERKAAVEALGQKGFRAKQLSTHYFERLVEAPEDMTDLPKAIRDELVAGLLPQLITPVRTLEADEGATIKSVWRLHDGALVESVLMRYPGRVTICVSSQAGCGMNCPFCATGQEGLTRNMSTDVSRALLAASYGHLGRFEEARDAWSDLLRVNPNYSLDYRRKILPYKNPADFERVVEGLRKAGIV